MTEAKRSKGTLTIYDVARLAGVSIASVSRVLNGQGTPRPETRERVMRAVGELSFVPDGAARALSNGLKEVVGVVFRRGAEATFEDEDESLLFIDGINRGIEVAAQHRELRRPDQLGGRPRSRTRPARIAGVAGKSDGIILHDRMLSAVGIARLAEVMPIVTLAGQPDPGVRERRLRQRRRDARAGQPPHRGPRVSPSRLPVRTRGQPGQPGASARLRSGRHRGRRRDPDRTGVAGELQRLRWRPGDRLAARPGRRAATRDRVRERPDRARRDPRARAAGRERPGRRRRHRLRRRPRRASSPPFADHRSGSRSSRWERRHSTSSTRGSAGPAANPTSSCRFDWCFARVAAALRLRAARMPRHLRSGA